MFVYNISYCTLNLKIYVVVEAGNKQNKTKRSLLMVEETEIQAARHRFDIEIETQK